MIGAKDVDVALRLFPFPILGGLSLAGDVPLFLGMVTIGRLVDRRVQRDATNGILKISSTNLDVGIEVNMPVRVEKDGIVAIPSNIFVSFISSIFNDKSVVLEVVDGNLIVKSTHSNTIIKTFDYNEFPTLPKTSLEKSFKTLPGVQ